VGCAAHTLGDRRKTFLQTTEVNESSHESRNLDRRSVDKGLNELLDRRKSRLLREVEALLGRRDRWCRRKVSVVDRSVVTTDDLRGLECQVRDHVLGDRQVDEVVESFGILLRSCHGVRHFDKSKKMVS